MAGRARGNTNDPCRFCHYGPLIAPFSTKNHTPESEAETQAYYADLLAESPNTDTAFTFTGKVTDAKTDEPLFAANVVVLQNKKLITGAETDFDGNYTIAGLKSGLYELRCTYTAMEEQLVGGFLMLKSPNKVVNFEMKSLPFYPCLMYFYRPMPLIDLGLDYGSGTRMTGNELRRMPIK